MVAGAYILNRDVRPLVARAQFALGMSQAEFGRALGVSKRTASRWAARQSDPSLPTIVALARLVYPVDRELAAQLAAAASATLVTLGLEAPPQQAPAPTPVDPALVADSVVCVAAAALGMAPDGVRPALLAAFRRARLLRLTFEDVERALAPPARATRSGP